MCHIACFSKKCEKMCFVLYARLFRSKMYGTERVIFWFEIVTQREALNDTNSVEHRGGVYKVIVPCVWHIMKKDYVT